jgi:colanic acid biosynthesis glycosyl transferase WcaI
MSIGAATAADVPGLVSAHREAFPEFFLTMLGERFLRRFYAAVVRDPDALCFVARSGGRVVGFVSGPLEPAGFFRKLLLREGIGFCLDAIPALMRRPGFVARRLWGAVTYRGEAPMVREHAALVSSIAVSPVASGRGLGRELLDAFCEAAASRGVSSVYLLTDRDYNSDTNQFYFKSGFTLESQVARSGGRAMNRYVREVRRSDTR